MKIPQWEINETLPSLENGPLLFLTLGIVYFTSSGFAYKPGPSHFVSQNVDGTNRQIQSVLLLNRKCIFKTLSTWLMDVNNLDFTPFTTEKFKIHCICCRCFVGRYELQHYWSSAVQLGAFLWACPFKIMLQ